MVLRLNEAVGTGGNDDFSGVPFSISFGLQGDDSFFASTFNDFTVFAGGSGNDTYFVQVVDTAITILDSGGTSDMVVANGIGFGFDSTFAATIDGRHLLVWDEFSGQQILIIDWQAPGNEIEWVQLADGLFSFDFIVANIFSAPNFLGDLTWAEAGILGDFTVGEMNEAIAFYSVVESTLESFGFPVIDGTSGNDTLFGTTLLDDVIRGGAGDDIIFGGAGNNFIDGGTGADIIDGGAGFDVASYQNSAAGVVVDLST